METDYKIDGTTCFWITKNWDNINLDTDILRVCGFSLINMKPKVGETLYCEFEKSHMIFQFVKVDSCHDPDDMYFADVKAIEQKMKETGEIIKRKDLEVEDGQ